MADITYCVNDSCPFDDCERHPSKIAKACEDGVGYVSMAALDSTCRRYIGWLVDYIEGEKAGE